MSANRAKIEVLKGAPVQTVHLDPDQPFTVGRAQTAGVHVLAGPVSREHCRLQFNGKVWLLTDLGSRNGTWVGETRVKARALCHGDVFSLGKAIFLKFTLEEEDGAPPRPAAPAAPGAAAKPGLKPSAKPGVKPLAKAGVKPLAAPKAASAKPAEPAPPPAPEADPEDIGICSFCRETVPGGETIHPDCRELSALLGTEIGGVRIIERVGGVPPVHRLRAHQPSLKRHVLLQGFLAEKLGGDAFRAKLLEEVRTISRLLHPRILQIHDLIDDKGSSLVVMEYFAGRPLSEVLRKQAFVKVPSALQIVSHIVEGLAYAETQDLVVDRLDPADIWVNEENQAKLDLFRPPLARTPAVAAISYMAPEIVTAGGTRPVTGRPAVADRAAATRGAVYGAGAILYHMLAGIPPFEGATVEELMPRILNKTPPALSRVNLKVSPALARIVERAMNRNPEERPADFRALQNDLRKLVTPGM